MESNPHTHPRRPGRRSLPTTWTLPAILALAAFAMPSQSSAQLAFSDSLTGPSSPNLSIPSDYSYSTQGLVRTGNSVYRSLVKTASGAYLTATKFTAEVAVNVAAGDIAFVGLGQGVSNPNYGPNEPTNGILFRIHNLGNYQSIDTAVAAGFTGSQFQQIGSIGNYAGGSTTVFRVSRDGDTVTLSVPSQNISRSYSLAQYQALMGLTDSNTRFFFGAGGNNNSFLTGTRFANASVTLPAATIAFPPPTSYQSWAGTNLATGDVNGDGKADIVSVKFPSANLFVAYNNGNGTFSEYPLFSGGGVNKAILADVNGDGKLDVVTVGNGPWGQGLTIYLNNGTGGFSAAFAYPTSDFSYWYGSQFNRSQPISVEAGKTTANGKVDLVVSDIKGFPLQVFRGVGDGSFVPGPKIPNPTGGTYGTRVLKLVDLDGDGDLDLVATGGYGSYFVQVWSNDGAGNFTSTFIVPVPSANATPLDLKVIDMNHDGRPDLVFSSVSFDVQGAPGTFFYYENTGNLANFVSHTAFSGQGQTTDGNGNWAPAAYGIMAAADLDHDGNVDLVTTPSNGLPAVLRNNGDGTFTPVWQAPSSSPTIPYGFVDTVYLVDIGGSGTLTLLGGKGQQSGGNRGIVYGELQGGTPPDTAQPVVTVPGPITAEATSASGAAVSFTYSATDDVAVTSLTSSHASGSTFPIGTTTVTVTAKDAAGNTGTGSFTVTVKDTTAPAITSVPSDIVAEATSASGATVNYAAATATDAVGVASITYSQASGTTFPLGTTTVTVTAKDAAGNSSTRSFTVTVEDTTAPAITSVSSDLVAEASSASGATVNYAAATATDAVGVASITYSQASGTTFPLGTTTVTVTAKDAAGNSSTRSFNVTVRDTTAPAITGLTASSTSLWPANHKMVAITITAAATDAVTERPAFKIISATSSEPDNGLGDGDTAGDIEITGAMTLNLRAERSGSGNGRTYTITVQATDGAGNASKQTVTVFVPKSQGK